MARPKFRLELPSSFATNRLDAVRSFQGMFTVSPLGTPFLILHTSVLMAARAGTAVETAELQILKVSNWQEGCCHCWLAGLAKVAGSWAFVVFLGPERFASDVAEPVTIMF